AELAVGVDESGADALRRAGDDRDLLAGDAHECPFRSIAGRPYAPARLKVDDRSTKFQPPLTAARHRGIPVTWGERLRLQAPRKRVAVRSRRRAASRQASEPPERTCGVAKRPGQTRVDRQAGVG